MALLPFLCFSESPLLLISLGPISLKKEKPPGKRKQKSRKRLSHTHQLGPSKKGDCRKGTRINEEGRKMEPAHGESKIKKLLKLGKMPQQHETVSISIVHPSFGYHHGNLKVMKKCRTLEETTMDYCSQHFPMWLYLAQMKLMSSSSREEITTTQEKFLNEHRKDFSNAFGLGEEKGGSFLRWGGPFLMPLLDKTTGCMAARLPTVTKAASSSLQDAILCPRFS
ncbi:uncharacterized protein LOC116549681 [Sapajus apella]|uniref:Uncharacterized protein LOC116549681 n=1 Tax=Sapajus apella TaxID=9515 RepID=A0A6J3HP00_SAPAP|nr:uncharacterized protein LOC116549681 [Sapajus apella]